MVEVYVPAGEFLMGSTNSDSAAGDSEKPQHTVELDAYWIDQTEVTQGMYALCVAAGQCSAPADFNSGPDYPVGATYPVVGVSWNDANDYCGWVGAQLPTEAQWEKAARGTDGRIYPWGNAAPTSTLANFNYTAGMAVVGSYPKGASPYGALDMAGNVWEWTADWYAADYYQNTPTTNPAGPGSGYDRVARGGAWNYYAHVLRTAYRGWFTPAGRNYTIGFRCARSP